MNELPQTTTGIRGPLPANRRGRAKTLRLYFALIWPRAFAPEDGPKQPLKIGITEAIVAAGLQADGVAWRVRLPPGALPVFGNPAAPVTLPAPPWLAVSTKGIAVEAVRVYCRGPSYLEACVAGAPRIDLDGNPAGVVSEFEATWARKELEATRARIAASRIGLRSDKVRARAKKQQRAAQGAAR